MKYLQIVHKLQNLTCNTDMLVLVKSGIFFYGVGKDAVILMQNLGLNYCCMQKGLCKCAIPVIKIENMIKKLKEKKISFVIYDYTPKRINENIGEKYKEITRYINSPIAETRTHFECNKCQFHNMFDNKAKIQQEKMQRLLNSIRKSENE